MVISSEHNIKDLDFGFTDRALNIFENTSKLFNYIINYYINKITNNPKWSKSILEKNKDSNKNLNELIKMDAKWMAKNYLTNCYIDSIKRDRNWLNKIREKALKNSIDLDSMIQIDANYIVSSQFQELITENIEKDKALNHIIEKIKSNNEWLKKTKEKAKTNNKTIKEQLEMDAKWLLNQEE